MRKLFSVLSLSLLFLTITLGQTVNIPLSATDGTNSIPLAVGLDATATDCIDPALGESDLPPFPPAGVFEIRFDLNPYGCTNLSTYFDYRNAPGFPFTGTRQHTLWYQTSSAGLPINVQYTLPTGASMTITDQIGGSFLNIGPFTGSGTATIPGTYTSIFTRAYLNMNYTNVGGGAAPIFGIAPPSLDFGSVDIGLNAMLPATVSNTGTADLVISNIVSSDPQFTFTPNTFPITIPAGGNQVFNVTFAPTSAGLKTATLTFTHNAAGSPTSYSVQGTGHTPGLVALENTFSATDGTTTIDLATGLDPAATDCIDPALGESDLPPFPPAGVFEIRFDLNPLGCTNLSSYKDYRFAADPLTFVGTKVHTLWYQTSTTGAAIQLTYNLHPHATMTITDQIGGAILNIGPFTGSGVATIPGSYTSIFTRALINISYAAGAAPIFGVNPTSLDFGDVSLGSSKTLNVNVTNTGTAPLVISNASCTPSQFTVTPTTFTIPAGGNRNFAVKFTPNALGVLPGTLTFTDNAPGSPHTVALTGNGIPAPLVSGLVFEKDSVHVYENAFYSNYMHLYNTDGYLHALQFRLLTNVEVGDNILLTYQSIQKNSSAIAGSNWILETNVVRGTINANGASKDTIYVLLYNINPSVSTPDLPPGNYENLFRVNYKVAKLPPGVLEQHATFRIFNAEGSTFEGYPVTVTPSRDIFTVYVEAAGGGYGDVNGDGCVDILDLIMVVDHILGRDSLDRTITPGFTTSEFERADIAPWSPGDPSPVPNDTVNVQDLSVIQWIILNGKYPNGQPVAPCGYFGKSDGTADATVTLYINSEGISAYIDAQIGIRGAQIEFTNIPTNPENMIISTPLGQGYYLRAEGLLRTLMYDRAGQKYIDAGVNNFMADMPFSIANPNDVTVAKIVLVDINRMKLTNITVQIVYGTPTLPLDYILFQNYPNPFNPSTSVKFQVPKTSDVTIKVYDMLGQEVRTLFAGQVMRGTYTVDWDGINNAGVKMSSGSYIYRMTAGEFVQSKKMILLK